MTAITLRLSTEMYQRFKRLAKIRGTTINCLLDEMTTLMLAEFYTETRCKARGERGRGKEERGLELLDKAMQE